MNTICQGIFTMTKEEFGIALKKMLDESGFTREKFAEFIGLKDPDSVYRWCRGERYPSKKWHGAICQALSCHITLDIKPGNPQMKGGPELDLIQTLIGELNEVKKENKRLRRIIENPQTGTGK